MKFVEHNWHLESYSKCEFVSHWLVLSFKPHWFVDYATVSLEMLSFNGDTNKMKLGCCSYTISPEELESEKHLCCTIFRNLITVLLLSVNSDNYGKPGVVPEGGRGAIAWCTVVHLLKRLNDIYLKIQILEIYMLYFS